MPGQGKGHAALGVQAVLGVCKGKGKAYKVDDTSLLSLILPLQTQAGDSGSVLMGQKGKIQRPHEYRI